MTHLPYIAASYVIAIAVPVFFSVGAMLRIRAASRRLDALDPRRTKGMS
jgi:hypothetical protein